MKKFYKKSKGITLIALVITIIILIILTGIGMLYISDDSGILYKTIFARENHKRHAIRESLNIELNNILTDQISKHKETSKESSLEEFQKLNYEVEEEGENDDLVCYIFEQGYIYEIEEKEDGYQEVVFVGEATKRKPRIMDLKLSIEDSKLKITTTTNRAEKYEYAVTLKNDNKKLDAITQKSEDKVVDYYIDLKELDKNINENVFGEFEVKVTAINKNNESQKYDSNYYNRSAIINVSKVIFDADGGIFDDDNDDKFIAFVETGKN